jgi:hypothetical protein
MVMAQDQYEQSLLEAAEQVSTSIEGRPARFRRIRWSARSEPDDPLFLHRKGTVVLHDRLREKLSPEEWKPLFVSSLFYRKRFQQRRRLGIIAYVASSTLVAALLVWFFTFGIILVFPGIANTGSTLALGRLFVFLALAPFILFAALTTPYMRRLRLASDRLASDELGIRTDLLNTLRKIDSFFIGQESGLAKAILRKPTIVERIRDLSSMQQKGA